MKDEEFMPEGWTEEEALFDEPMEEPATEPTATEETAEEPAGKAEEPTATEETAEEPAGKAEEPTAGMLRFKARIDHRDEDVEIPVTDLPGLYQRAAVTDRAQARMKSFEPTLAKLGDVTKALGYNSADEMLDGVLGNLRTDKLDELTSQGVPEELARDYVDRSMPQQQTTQQPDYRAEVDELLQARPELRGKQLPDEVVQACVSTGQSLVRCYAEYESRQAKNELDALRKENSVLKQNAANMAKAPVTGVSKGGATDNAPSDAFLQGFDSGWG